jgi:hypothetical protein
LFASHAENVPSTQKRVARHVGKVVLHPGKVALIGELVAQHAGKVA